MMPVRWEGSCPDCGRGFVLTRLPYEPAPTVYPRHFLAVNITEGQRGAPQWRQGTELCPRSGTELAEN